MTIRDELHGNSDYRTKMQVNIDQPKLYALIRGHLVGLSVDSAGAIHRPARQRRVLLVKRRTRAMEQAWVLAA